MAEYISNSYEQNNSIDNQYRIGGLEMLLGGLTATTGWIVNPMISVAGAVVGLDGYRRLLAADQIKYHSK